MDTSTQQITPAKIDASKYIRTFAKDMAAVSGKTPVTLEPQQNKKKSRKEKKKLSERTAPENPFTAERPSKTPADLSILERQAEADDSKIDEKNLADFGTQQGDITTIDLPSIDSETIVKDSLASLARSEETDLSDAEATVPIEQDRSAILARLRAKTATPANAVLFPTSYSAPTVPQQPITPAPEVVPTPLPQPSSLTMVDRTNSANQAESEPAPLHTFKTDFADEIDRKGANTFSVLAAENDAPAPRATPEKSRAPLAIAAGIVLLLIGGGAAVAGYFVLSSHAPVALLPGPAAIIAPDSRITLSTTNEAILPAFAALTNNAIPGNSIEQVVLPAASSTDQGVTTQNNVLSQLDIAAPDILVRNVDPTSMAGIVNDGSEIRPFFVLRVTSYERTFAGMLQWEPTMPNDLNALYPMLAQPNSNSSSTPASQVGFVDEVVASHNARAYKDAEGNTVFLYGYADPQTLIIARSEAAFELLLNRLQSAST